MVVLTETSIFIGKLEEAVPAQRMESWDLGSNSSSETLGK